MTNDNNDNEHANNDNEHANNDNEHANNDKEHTNKDNKEKQEVTQISNMNQSSQPSTSHELRENLISLATSFLSSPNVRSASDEQKRAFLVKKGLNDQEIKEAFTRVGEKETIKMDENVNVSSTSPSKIIATETRIAPRIPPYTSTQMKYSRTDDLLKKLVYTLLFTGGFTVTVIAALRIFISPMINQLFSARSELYTHQQNIMKKLYDRLNEFNKVSLRPIADAKKDMEVHSSTDMIESGMETPNINNIHITDTDTNGNTIGEQLEPTNQTENKLDTNAKILPSTFLSPLEKSLSQVADLTSELKSQHTLSFESLRESVTELCTFVTTRSYMSSSYSSILTDYSFYIKNSQESMMKADKEPDVVENCKNEIRSLKGMLLARRIFVR